LQPRYSSRPEVQRGPDRELIEQLERDILDTAPNVRFADIAGLEVSKNLLQEAVVLPQICPSYFTGVREPWRGVLLFGPPGTGKTLLAKAVATECRTTFMSVGASTLGSKWRGESEKLVRNLFEMAAYYAPTVLFFDEVDSIARKRSEADDETSRRVKTELLTAMDGLKSRGGGMVMVLAATNRPDELDDAFLRRFEKRVYIPLPSRKDREVLFRLKLGAIVGKDVNFEEAARLSNGYSGADLAVVCKTAAFRPGRRKEAELKKQFPRPEQHTQYLQALQNALEHSLPPPVLHEDLIEALAVNKPSASPQSLELYARWEAAHGAS
jgi:katanin p60 ATPase-containing subunit A1